MRRVGFVFVIVLFLLSCDIDPMDIDIENGAPPYFTVTYHSEGHTAGEPPVDSNRYVAPNVDSDGLFLWPAEPDTVIILGQGTLEREGFYFHGWSGRDGDGWVIEGDSFRLQQNLELHAIWEKEPPVKYFTITYHSEGHTAGEPPVDENEYLVPRRTMTVPPNAIVRPETATVFGRGTLEKEGYIFHSWQQRQPVYVHFDWPVVGGPPTVTVLVTENIDFDAMWTPLW